MTEKQPRNRARNAQERAAAEKGGYVPGSRGYRAQEVEKLKSKGETNWRKLSRFVPRYAVVITRTRIVVLEGGGDVPEAYVAHVVGPYDIFKRAEADAKRWTLGSWSASVMALEQRAYFDEGQVLNG